MAHSFVVICDEAFVTTIQLVFLLSQHKIFHDHPPNARDKTHVRYKIPTVTFGQDKCFVETFFSTGNVM
jgi:hypothetical protein